MSIKSFVQRTMGAAKNASNTKQPLAPTPMAPTPMAPSYKAEAAPTSLPQFAMQRQQAQSRLQGQGQLQQDALNRRFAQLGGGPSGAAIKAQQNLGAEQAMQQEDVMGGINAQELGAIQSLQEAEKGRVFQAGQADVARAQQESQFGKQFGLSQQELAMAKRAAKQQEAADKFNRAIAGSELQGNKLDRFQNIYKGGLGALGRKANPSMPPPGTSANGMVLVNGEWKFPVLGG